MNQFRPSDPAPQLGAVISNLDRLIYRARYYGDGITLIALDDILHDLRRAESSEEEAMRCALYEIEDIARNAIRGR